MPKDKQNKIYFYVVGYGSYEEAPEIVLSSTKHYSKESFFDLCANITRDFYDNRHKNFLKEHVYFSQKENRRFELHFDDIYVKLAEELCKKYGFKETKKEVVFMPYGWADILDGDDWARETSEDIPINVIRNKIFGRRHLLLEKIPIFDEI